MRWNYDFNISFPEEAMAAIGLWFVMMLFALAIALVFYIFESLGLYTLAKRRGIRHPGLAWVPVGNSWILGCLADQYNSVARGKRTKQRRILLWIQIAILILVVAIIAILFVNYFATLDIPRWAGWSSHLDFEDIPFDPVCLFLVFGCYLAIVALAITYTVFTYISLYRLYQSCDPNTAVVFLLLSIFISGTMPFLVFADRKKDNGMIAVKEQFGGACNE